MTSTTRVPKADITGLYGVVPDPLPALAVACGLESMSGASGVASRP